MERPYKYAIICQKTGNIQETNIEPSLHSLQTYEPTREPNIRAIQQTKVCYIDTRYSAKIRLYNYLTYTRKGLPIPEYRPFANTEVGKSLPILNF